MKYRYEYFAIPLLLFLLLRYAQYFPWYNYILAKSENVNPMLNISIFLADIKYMHHSISI